jgi:CrcB protein
MSPWLSLAVFLGAGCGALARWWLNLALAPAATALPLGNLAANVGGGLLMGAMLALFAQFEGIPVAWRLAITTGFLGGLTTFSGFTAESTELLLRAEYRLAGLHVLLHVGAALGATVLGLLVTRAVVRSLA